MMDHEGRAEPGPQPGPDRELTPLEKVLRRLEGCVKRTHEIAERLERAAEPIMAPEVADKMSPGKVEALQGPASATVVTLDRLCDGLDASSEQIARTISRFDV